MSERTTGGSIDELLDAAVAAVNRGELDTAHQLARRVLAADASHPEAGDLLATTATPGSMRRLTIMFCDLVGSTELSARHDPERYRQILLQADMPEDRRGRLRRSHRTGEG